MTMFDHQLKNSLFISPLDYILNSDEVQQLRIALQGSRPLADGRCGITMLR